MWVWVLVCVFSICYLDKDFYHNDVLEKISFQTSLSAFPSGSIWVNVLETDKWGLPSLSSVIVGGLLPPRGLRS